MTEEFELYNPDPDSSEVMVVYRGEEHYGPIYLDLEEVGDDGVDVEHEGTPWGGYEQQEEDYDFYDEPKRREDESYGDKETEEEQNDQGDTEEEGQDENQDEEEEPSLEDLIAQEFEQEESPSGLLLGGIAAGMIAMYVVLFLLGPFTFAL